VTPPDPDAVLETVTALIARTEQTGEATGGSGHLSHVSFGNVRVTAIEPAGEGRWRVGFSYAIYVETEFTYWPDNPPHEYPKEGEVLVDDKGREIEPT
jgi:hypothetical protein